MTYVEAGAWSIGASGGSYTQLIIEIAGNAAQNIFGIYSLTQPWVTLEIFGGGASGGSSALIEYDGDGRFVKNFDEGSAVEFGGSNFGFYLAGPGGTFYSDSERNGGDTQMVAFQGGQDRYADFFGTGSAKWLENEWVLAWEDLIYGNSDADFNDFVVLVESVTPVPAPGALALFGAGLIAVGFGRRRGKLLPGSI